MGEATRRREVAVIVKAAERLEPDDLRRARIILNSGVTLEEYRRFEAGRTFRTAVLCLIWMAIFWAANEWFFWKQ